MEGLKKMKKGLLALLATFMLIGIAAGCSNATNTEDPGTEENQTGTEDTGTEDTGTEEGTEEGNEEGTEESGN
ncbi:hypothetical protein SAMN05877753_11063 [Bacillus oleivorans]|uniref:Uncharacterized protein n=1 Tax=Bacillus oleivorans TaxID=1448271 RepID=A0A285D681_9BACI|nr:hypothetical protein [Bacillus oleivorans]SNX74768.1 hypothetical protein SAMN05877753_11063 [Bacillus oleivorans]